MKCSVVYLTGRKETRLDWLLESIREHGKAGDEIEIIAVDALHRTREFTDRRVRLLVDELAGKPDGPAVTIRPTAPKPTIWQGEHRIMDRDWWAASNGRNTGIVLASHDYLVFCDDRCKPGPKWLATVRKGESGALPGVIAGTYDKLEGPADARKRVTDHRRSSSPGGRTNCGGQWLYGCTLALPLDWALRVNGFEEGCDSLTGEDYIFGMMLSNAGYRIDFNTDLYVLLDRDHGDVSMKGTYACTDKGESPNDKSHAAIRRFGKRSRTEFTPDLRELRERMAKPNAKWPVPDPAGDYRDWYDGQDYRDMRPPP